MNDDVTLGYSADPNVFYGTSASGLVDDRKAMEGNILSDGPVDGPINTGSEIAPSNRLSAMAFAKSPAGMLLILLPITFLVFHKVFGNG